MTWIWQQREWPSLRWDERALVSALTEVRHAQGTLHGQARALGVLSATAEHVAPLVRDALGTAAIEGERPDPASVRSSVLRRLNLPTAGLSVPPRSTDGLVEMLLDATQHFDEPLTEARLFAWHSSLFAEHGNRQRRVGVGRYRGPGPMRVVSGSGDRERIHFEAPQSGDVPAEMRTLVTWFDASRGAIDGLLRAGLAHLHFVTVHPFDDGNGRIARAITDLALAQADRLPVRLQCLSARILDVRDAYYTELERAQRGNLDVTPWLAWFLEQVRVSATDATARLDSVRQRRDFWQRDVVADLNARQHKALTRMLDALPGEFEGGMTNRKYVALTRCSRATAQRDLEALATLGCLRPVGDGRSRRYELRLDGD